MQSLHISIPYICSLLSSFSYQMLTWKTTEDIYYIKPLKNKTKTKPNKQKQFQRAHGVWVKG